MFNTYFYRQALSTVAVCFAFRVYKIRNPFTLTSRHALPCARVPFYSMVALLFFTPEILPVSFSGRSKPAFFTLKQSGFFLRYKRPFYRSVYSQTDKSIKSDLLRTYSRIVASRKIFGILR